MLAAEILAYDADIICLQEVDCCSFSNFMDPLLTSKGYTGFYCSKVSVNQNEGCAMFWKTAVFDCNFSKTVPMRDVFSNNAIISDSWGSMKDVNKLLKEHSELSEIVHEKVGTIFQFACLSLKRKTANDAAFPEPECILVANTHLYFHPLADHIRAIQCLALCQLIDELRASKDSKIPFLLCGDLNSDPTSGAYRLLLNRKIQVSDESKCWKYLNHFKWNDKNENESTVEVDPSEFDFDEGSNGKMNKSIPPALSLPE